MTTNKNSTEYKYLSCISFLFCISWLCISSMRLSSSCRLSRSDSKKRTKNIFKLWKLNSKTTVAGSCFFTKPDINTTELALSEQVGLVLMVGILHFALQLLAGLKHVLLHLLPLLLLHFIQGLPTLGVLKFKSAWTSKTGRFLSLSIDESNTIDSVLAPWLYWEQRPI